MNHPLPIGCEIPQHRRKGEITWLEIHHEDGGYYVYQCPAQGKPPKWDTFDATADLQEILWDCKQQWGVNDDAWQPVCP